MGLLELLEARLGQGEGHGEVQVLELHERLAAESGVREGGPEVEC